MALYKKEILVRPNSTEDFAEAMDFAQNWLDNTFQNIPANKDANGNFIDYFFADVYFAEGHANGGQLWRIYTGACKDQYGLQPAPSGRIEFLIMDKVSINNAIVAEHDKNAEQDDRITALENNTNGTEAEVI